MKELKFWLKLGALGAALGAAVFFLFMEFSLKGGTVTMPNLKGMPKKAAEMKLRSLGLDMTVREERYSSTAPFGAILEQSLEPGATLKRGRTIAVAVSIGDKQLTVPELVGSPSARQARLLLEQNGLQVGRVAYIPSEQPAETVLAQSPEGGREVARGEGVSLLVSSGPAPVIRLMPNLRGKSLGDARALAERMGLILRKVGETDATGAAPGSVVGQNLTPSTRVAAGAELDLWVAPGGAAQGDARLATVEYTVPNDGIQERRVRFVVRDSLGERTVYNRMQQPGALIRQDVQVHGAASLEISLGGEVAETRVIP